MTISWWNHTLPNRKGKISWKCFYASLISLAPSTHVQKCASVKNRNGNFQSLLRILWSLSRHLRTQSRMYIQHYLGTFKPNQGCTSNIITWHLQTQSRMYIRHPSIRNITWNFPEVFFSPPCFHHHVNQLQNHVPKRQVPLEILRR